MSRPQAASGAVLSARVPRPSAEVIGAVRASCRAVAHRPVALAEAFYGHLFEMAPQLRAMFAPDLTGQMQRMSDTLLGAVAQLEAADTVELEAALRRLGAVHGAQYGVDPEHYRYVGHALTRAVRDVSGPSYSGYLSSSWIAVTQWVAAHMVAGAEAEPDGDDGAPLHLPRQRGPRDRD